MYKLEQYNGKIINSKVKCLYKVQNNIKIITLLFIYLIYIQHVELQI